MKDTAAKTPPQPAVLSLAQLLAEQPAAPPPGWIEPGLLPPQGILFVGGEPKVGKSLLVANLALALAAGKDRAGFRIPAARRVLVCQFELPTPQFVSRLATMRRSLGAAADQNLLVDTRASGMANKAVLLSGVSAKFPDYDNDGWVDVVQANGAMLDNITLFHSEVASGGAVMRFQRRPLRPPVNTMLTGSCGRPHPTPPGIC